MIRKPESLSLSTFLDDIKKDYDNISAMLEMIEMLEHDNIPPGLSAELSELAEGLDKLVQRVDEDLTAYNTARSN